MTLRQRFFAALLASLMAFVTASTCSARSNVLFIDLNNAEAEIDAVKSALPRDGSRVFTIPPSGRFDATRRAEILEVQQRFNATTRLATECPPSRQESCRALWNSLRRIAHGAITIDRRAVGCRHGEQRQITDQRWLRLVKIHSCCSAVVSTFYRLIGTLVWIVLMRRCGLPHH